ncbi:MAG: sucrase ferredoxin [Chloroflexota bacterium]
MTARRKNEKVYCNVAARELGLDPAGYAGYFNDAVLIETALPWKRSVYQEAGALPQEAIDIMGLWMQRYQETGVFGHRPLLIAPDDEYSEQGHRRIVYYERPCQDETGGMSNTMPNAIPNTMPFAEFARMEYLVPEEDAGRLLWALFEDKETLPEFDAYRINGDTHVRDILVCTHGTIDVACAKFGYPLYDLLRTEFAMDTAQAQLRVWRVSHFGGHVFAPTLMDMPTGHYWAYVGEAQAAQIVERNGDVADLRDHYRGWAGLEAGFAQAAEREMWQREGWAWFDYARRGNVTAKDVPADENKKPQWADVSVHYATQAGAEQSYHAHVEVCRTVETAPSTDHDKLFAYSLYDVTKMVS